MIYGILIFLATISADLITDVGRYYDKKKVNHTRGALLRLIGIVPAAYFMGWVSAPMLLFWYWVLFNGLYNVFIGKEWEFVGTTAWIDRMIRKHPWINWVKYGGLVNATILYFWLK